MNRPDLYSLPVPVELTYSQLQALKWSQQYQFGGLKDALDSALKEAEAVHENLKKQYRREQAKNARARSKLAKAKVLELTARLSKQSTPS